MDCACSLPSFWIVFIISTFCPKIFFPFYSCIVALHQLAACRSLCFLIEDANFHEQDFIEFLPTCWELCFKLIEDVQEFDSKVSSATVLDDLWAISLRDYFWGCGHMYTVYRMQLLEITIFELPAFKNAACLWVNYPEFWPQGNGQWGLLYG